ncbi:hypothetical protein DES53_101665 [Roseimicrobium gellanilyticum]|uniref:Uncharacterized protein n=1 Tax=Roseimicrobium gellanilyticum TaxID=748857 RepID=A0A366HWJ3_9BACT|nr:hypothetical protein [Roseimicrobium gellanilyticum]RBP47865.1 hypothetical protein DES53_101665 [Roseimicrobium gellanilyticum]
MHSSLSRASAVLAVLLAGMTTDLDAQSPPAPLDKAQLKAQVDARQKRSDLMLDELKASDARIEATVDRIIETLKMVGDSKDSRTKVARLKEDTVKRLAKNIEFYQRKRADLMEQMRRPTLNLTMEQKQRAIAKVDSRMEKRVQQILALNQSMPQHQDYDKYKEIDNGWYGTTFAVNEDYKQNQRLMTHTNAQRGKILEGLQKSVDRLEQYNRTLNGWLAKATGDEHRKTLQGEIARNEELLKERRTQIVDLAKPALDTSRPISGKEAQDMDMALRKTVDSLQREFTTLFQRYSTYLQELSSVNTAKAALAAAK